MGQVMDVYQFAENEGILDDFLLVPVSLFHDDKLAGISNPSKLLYVLMLARLYADPKEDKDGHIYITYTLREISGDLNCTTPTAMHYIEELAHWGLVRKGERVNGAANKIYLTADWEK